MGVPVKCDDRIVVDEDLFLGEAKFPGEDTQKLSLDSVNVLLGETGGGGPCFILVCAVVGILGSNHESTKEHSLIGPILGLEMEIWFCPGDID